MTINQQITWLEDQIRHMKKTLPMQVAAGRISEKASTHKLACAESAYRTLTQLRGIVRGEGPKP